MPTLEVGESEIKYLINNPTTKKMRIYDTDGKLHTIDTEKFANAIYQAKKHGNLEINYGPLKIKIIDQDIPKIIKALENLVNTVGDNIKKVSPAIAALIIALGIRDKLRQK